MKEERFFQEELLELAANIKEILLQLLTEVEILHYYHIQKTNFKISIK
jgi:hypothetical protein